MQLKLVIHFDAHVVGIPRTQKLSLIAIGMPSKMPCCCDCCHRCDDFSAASAAVSVQARMKKFR